MKIGILTLPLHTNYGGILQAYALQTILQRMGHDVKVIDYDSMKYRPHPIWKRPLAYSKRILENLLGHPTPIFIERKIYKEQPVIRQYTNRFINKYIDRRIIDNFNEIHQSEFDAYIVGSDQVWRPKYFELSYRAPIDKAYLSFTEGWDVMRISYAASFGVDFWEYDKLKTASCRYLLKSFDAVSVREDSAVLLCDEYFGIKAEHVLDPTMLLSKEDYEELIKEMPKSECYRGIMTYVLDNSDVKQDIINSLSNLTGLQSFPTCAKSDINSSLESRIQPPLEDWLRAFRDAELVVTDSFHACVFSILFRKPFVVVANVDRGASRFTSLLKMFGLENRMVSSIDDIREYHYCEPLPESVYQCLERMRDLSNAFLSVIK